ncbi:MAG: ribonuclease P protein component [Bifidobacteriaceae bacterium]|nr:ribonuclease P protein component [Bifidobacteriaceae bacterium]
MKRLANHSDFISVLRIRHRVSTADIVAHYAMRSQERNCHAQDPEPRLGLAVSNSVGKAVVRNRIKRRFRTLGREYSDLIPPQCDVVLRAKKGAAQATFSSLEKQICSLFCRIQERTGRQSSHIEGESN